MLLNLLLTNKTIFGVFLFYFLPLFLKFLLGIPLLIEDTKLRLKVVIPSGAPNSWQKKQQKQHRLLQIKKTVLSK